MNTNYNTSLFSGMHILKEVCYMMTSFPAIHIFHDSVIFSLERLKRPYIRNTVFISQHLLQPPSIITTGLWLLWEKLKSMFISGKPLWSCYFKGTYLFHRTSCNNCFLKSTVLNDCKHLQRFHSFMVNVLIWQFHNSNFKYSFSIVNVLEEQLLTFPLLRVNFGTVTFC